MENGAREDAYPKAINCLPTANASDTAKPSRITVTRSRSVSAPAPSGSIRHICIAGPCTRRGLDAPCEGVRIRHIGRAFP
jgi:hypothetical protein